MFFFFFSSRRRHTRFDCDWSSDVCSSDLSPDAFDVFLSVDFVAMIIVGGLGSVPGSVAGAAVLTVLNDSLAGFQNYRPLLFGALLIASMLFMPGGIASAVRRLKEGG